ncbi:hypothetical protein IMG5_167020 [Ichthyophthirius multifiliis]|uniref:Uncharacterized protein n=1 Tax=Ichthyophthirius multifiliis TaxID=5932 RepID=G0R0U8_ICHMU|nr:hypothetical protein IMG5_167020 [Ichthyophthirius multifiliis]EGR28908.1 hypothetical protein IMG5_167020 [Ichthyophthirius multifiliis]|eukprot:XP_004030144.1 hypothetical protein IMG5_167020 [Ichthyophthirius multifiliis]
MDVFYFKEEKFEDELNLETPDNSFDNLNEDNNQDNYLEEEIREIIEHSLKDSSEIDHASVEIHNLKCNDFIEWLEQEEEQEENEEDEEQ